MRPTERRSDAAAPTADAALDAAPCVPSRAISLSSLRLHAQGLLASFERGQVGFVPDDYLAGFGDDAASAVLELCLAGVWARGDGGYQVVSSEALRMAHEVHRQMQHETPPETRHHRPEPRTQM
jgi:hypothetical protein